MCGCVDARFCDIFVWGFGCVVGIVFVCFFFFQAEDGIRDLVRSRGLGDVYKRQGRVECLSGRAQRAVAIHSGDDGAHVVAHQRSICPVSYTHLTLPTIYSV